MAVFPQGKTRVRERVRGGERKLFEALARQLEDDYIVWHNIPIMGSGREPDFVLLHPQRGLLILEVKDWKRRTIADANPMLVSLATDAGPVSVQHPVAQARGYALEIVHVLEKHPALRQGQGAHQGKLVLPWGWGAVLSQVRKTEVEADESFHAVFEPHKVLLAEDLGEDVDAMDFQEKLWGMFSVHWRCMLTLPQLGIVRGLLFPELRIDTMPAPSARTGAPALVVRDVLQVMDLHQESIARGIGDGHRLIHGPAGSGKTMILIFRAMQLQASASPERPILVLCFNRALAERIDAILRLKGAGPAVQVRTFHAWALDLVRTYQLAPVRRNLAPEDFDALAGIACEGIAAQRVPQGQYAALLIDEAHDLADDWLAAAVKMVDPATRSLLVMYDDAQSIYQKSRRQLSFARLGIEARGRTEVLRVNYRNTREVLSFAVECTRALLQERAADEDQVPLVMPQSAGRAGPVPAMRRFTDSRQESGFVADSVAQQVAQGRAPGDIAILAPRWGQLEAIQQGLARAGVPAVLTRERGAMRDPLPVKLATLHSSKGLEFPVVYVGGIEALQAHGPRFLEDMRLLYVGMTRATEELHLSAARETPVVRHIAESLERATQALA